jgi:hypothetical protein
VVFTGYGALQDGNSPSLTDQLRPDAKIGS